jgi:UDP-N-acetylmuramoylalanine--D-glutamate ligase
MRSIVNKHVAIVGLGASGTAAARAALSRGAKVTALDSAVTVRPETLRALTGVNVVTNVAMQKPGYVLPDADLYVVSPGVPPFDDLRRVAEQGILLSELEFAYQLRNDDAVMIAVGGTNGKSTVTTLLGLFCEQAYQRLFVGGNLGEPFSTACDRLLDAAVLEVSSFQLEHPAKFRPRASVLLNITEDHLDRYPDFQRYAEAKGNAFIYQESTDLAVVPYGDPICMLQVSRGNGRVITFGAHAKSDVQVLADAIVDHRDGTRYPRDAIAMQGEHNHSNAAAAIAVARDIGVSSSRIRDVLSGFRGLAHRTALVRTRGGVNYYDDSKGTNVGASIAALAGLAEAKAVLICGGKDKGGSYAPLAAVLRKKGRAVVMLGEAAPLIDASFAQEIPDLPRIKVSRMAEAVAVASTLAKPGDAVLLSPACASFDMFRDYKHRGDVFAEAVLALAEVTMVDATPGPPTSGPPTRGQGSAS